MRSLPKQITKKNGIQSENVSKNVSGDFLCNEMINEFKGIIHTKCKMQNAKENLIWSQRAILTWAASTSHLNFSCKWALPFHQPNNKRPAEVIFETIVLFIYEYNNWKKKGR